MKIVLTTSKNEMIGHAQIVYAPCFNALNVNDMSYNLIDVIQVNESFRRKGFGTKLLKLCMSELEGKILAYCNEKSEKMCLKFGFVDTGEYTLDKFGNNYKILVYENPQIQSN